MVDYAPKQGDIVYLDNTLNDFPLHIRLDERVRTTGALLTQHVRTIDSKARQISFVESAPSDILERVKKIIYLFF
ncbi:hypothetical protein AGMMS49975_10650 [Clostridia bacterium]|nr:hypothetical protein AGMMS49975_10650 [Clostridia bacterium]